MSDVNICDLKPKIIQITNTLRRIQIPLHITPTIISFQGLGIQTKQLHNNTTRNVNKDTRVFENSTSTATKHSTMI